MEHPPMAATVFYTNFAKNHNLYRYIESYKERAISSEREREREMGVGTVWGLDRNYVESGADLPVFVSWGKLRHGGEGTLKLTH